MAAQVAALTETSPIILQRVGAGTMGVVGARYDLDTGQIIVL